MSKLYSIAKVLESATGEKAIRETAEGTFATFIASASPKDRDGESINPKGWSLKTDAPLLVNHDYRVQAVVGRIVRGYVDGDHYLNDVLFADKVQENELARFTVGMMKQGFLGPCSVGFMPEEWTDPDGVRRDSSTAQFYGSMPGRRYEKQEQLELSVVPVGSLREATVLRSFFGPDPIEIPAEVLQRIEALENALKHPTQTDARDTETQTHWLDRYVGPSSAD